MFEPDGRNDLQYSGHLAVKALYYAAIALGVVCLTPAVTYVYVREDLHVQEATIAAFRENAPVQTLVLDYNAPTLTVADVAAADRAYINQKNPAATSLPFSVEVGPARKDLEVGNITPQWVNAYLSFSPGVLPEQDLKTYDFSLVYTPEGLKSTQGRGGGFAFDRMWDWGSGYGHGLLYAKVVPNCIAYTRASRAASIMRAFATVHVLGWDFGDVFTNPDQLSTRHELASPAKAASLAYRWRTASASPTQVMPGAAAAQFVQVYNSIFVGKLPVVVLHLQRLGDFKLEGADYLDSGAPPGSARRRQVMGNPKYISTPEITGMVLGRDTDLRRGRPEYSALDYLIRSAPCADDDSAEAVAALNRMTSFAFWRPLLVAEGITSAQDLRDAETTLGLLQAEMDTEVKAETIIMRSVKDVRF